VRTCSRIQVRQVEVDVLGWRSVHQWEDDGRATTSDGSHRFGRVDFQDPLPAADVVPMSRSSLRHDGTDATPKVTSTCRTWMRSTSATLPGIAKVCA